MAVVINFRDPRDWVGGAFAILTAWQCL